MISFNVIQQYCLECLKNSFVNNKDMVDVGKIMIY